VIFLGCDLKVKHRSLKVEMYKRFAIDGNCPLYDPEEFKELCAKAGARTTLFAILGAMTNTRLPEG